MENEKVHQVVLVYTKHEEGLYIDGELVSSDAGYDLPFLITGMTLKFTHRHRLDCDQNWFDNVGELPETFDELLENEHMWDEDNRGDN